MRSRVCIVTGATAGIGREIARNLACQGASLTLPCRDLERGERAREDILRDAPDAQIALVELDLASQPSIRSFVREFTRKHPALHVLVNNAGIVMPTRTLGPDGIELTWATNVLAYHLLSELLLDLLLRSGPARIVNVASTAAGGLDVSDVQFARRRYTKFNAYRQSKQANRMLSWALAERLRGTSVTVNVAHPGLVASELPRHGNGIGSMVDRAFFALFGKSPRKGADTAAWLASSADVDGVSGRFWASRRELRCAFRDPGEIEALRELCDAMTRDTAA